MFRDRFGKVIYVGKALNLRKRLSSYFQPARQKMADGKLRSLINSIDDWSIEIVRSEDEALILESRLIKDFAPHYNILMRDDKRYLLLKVDWSEKFPTLKLARIKKNDNALYFGPFPKGSALKLTLEFLLAYFGLRACKDSEPNEDTKKRCLKRIVKDCSAPCTGDISCEDYGKKLDAALKVLNGDIGPLCDDVRQKMAGYAANQRFEKAAQYRDLLSNLEAVFGTRNRSFERPELPGYDLGMPAVRALADALALSALPRKIICFDNSNILGQTAVAGMVAMQDGKPDRANYRRFKIKTVDQADDFATMHEVLCRHFKRLLEEKRELPDLVVIDGGKGQLSSAITALIEVGCPPLAVIGLAKRNEEIFIPGRSEPILLDRHHPGLRIIQALRDEAHRFAVSFHRELRLKRISESKLDEIPGIGDIRKKEILKTVGSIRELRKLSAEEIAAKVPGLGLALAQKIKESL